MITSHNCQTCNRAPNAAQKRRHRCIDCQRLVCGRCCVRGGRGQGQGSVRWAQCFGCQTASEARRAFKKNSANSDRNR